MMHRIRCGMQSGSFVKSKMTGTVARSMSPLGGLARNMHKSIKVRRDITRDWRRGQDVPVQGLLERHGNANRFKGVVAHAASTTRRPKPSIPM